MTKVSAHRIRLPQPWSVTRSCVSDPNRADVWVTTHEFQRAFQLPTGLTPDSKISLEILLANGHDVVVGCSINENALTVLSVEAGQFHAAVPTQSLLPTNRLCVRVVRAGDVLDEALPQVALVLT